MKTSLLLCALAFAAPAIAQTTPPATPSMAMPQAPTQAKDWHSAGLDLGVFNFDFVTDYAPSRHHLAWNRATPQDVAGVALDVPFFVHDCDAQGTPVREQIRFMDAENRVLTTLTATFDAKGKLDKQEARDTAGGAVLQVPNGQDVAVDASVMQMRTETKDGFLAKRFFVLPTADGGKAFLTCYYDKRGRRIRDVAISSIAMPERTVTYSYDARGLSQTTFEKTKDAPETRLSMERDKSGANVGVRVTEAGQLVSVSKALRDAKGTTVGSRSETYEGGKLAKVVEVRHDEKGDIHTQFDAKGQVTARQTRQNGRITTEMIENGKVTARIEANEKGEIERETNYNADGTFAETTRADGIVTVAVKDAKGVMIKRTVGTPEMMQFSEYFEQGKLRDRLDYNELGTPGTVTHYREDGSVETKRKVLGADAEGNPELGPNEA